MKSELTPVSADWKNIGIALRLPIATLNWIHAENGGRPSDCLTSMVTQWLKRNYKVEKFGEPTWHWLVQVVGDPAGGADMALARKIARRHKAGGRSSGYKYRFKATTYFSGRLTPIICHLNISLLQ